jgi:multidrug efflux pump subunit AcrA (membrane-fusion protein)
MTILNMSKIPQKAQRYLTCFIFFSLIIGLAGCHNSANKAEEKIVARTPVTVSSPLHKSISETLELPAVSIFVRKNIIRSATTGTVEAVSVTPGDFVKKGELLFTVKTLEASALHGSLNGDSALVFKGLIKTNSPKDGVISSVSHQTGDFVQEGDELAVMSDQNSLVFNLEVPFELRKYIEQGRSCLLRFPDSTIVKGVISGRLPEMDAQSQTISYLIQPLGTGRLPQNLMTTAIINKSTRTNVQVLPRAALLGNETQTEFWIMKVVNDSTAVKIPVKKGIENYNEVEITEPQFLPDDRIIVTGNYGLGDTAAIIINR